MGFGGGGGGGGGGRGAKICMCPPSQEVATMPLNVGLQSSVFLPHPVMVMVVVLRGARGVGQTAAGGR